MSQQISSFIIVLIMFDFPSGSHHLSSESESSVRSNVSIGAGPSDQNEPADLGGSGRVTCAGKTLSGASSVA